MRHVDLAADLEKLRRPVEALRDLPDGADVSGDIFAHRPVAPRGRLQEPPALVAQRKAQPVDLGLGGVGERILRAEAEIAPDARVEIGDLLVLEGVGEREHPHRVHDLGEALGGGGAHPFARAVGALEVGKARLDLGVPPFQRVVFRVADLGRVLAVIGVVRPRDRPGETGELRLRLLGAQRLHRDRLRVFRGHARLPPSRRRK
mgnify:CR=1 FL=1